MNQPAKPSPKAPQQRTREIAGILAILFILMQPQGEIESAISDGMSRFEQEYMGRGPKDIRAHLIDDILFVRLQGVEHRGAPRGRGRARAPGDASVRDGRRYARSLRDPGPDARGEAGLARRG